MDTDIKKQLEIDIQDIIKYLGKDFVDDLVEYKMGQLEFDFIFDK